METQTSSLVTMQAATDEESVAAFVDETLAGTGWEVDSIRHRVNRIDPPNSYWSIFSVDIYKDGEERNLRLVAKGALNPEAWEQLSARLMRHGAGNPCDPINGLGYPRLFPETQHAYWYYPYDPSMPNLPLANVAARMADEHPVHAHGRTGGRSACRDPRITRRERRANYDPGRAGTPRQGRGEVRICQSRRTLPAQGPHHSHTRARAEDH